MADETDVHGARTGFQVGDLQLVEGLWQTRVVQIQASLVGFNAKSQAGLEDKKNGSGGPCLGIAGDRVEGRSFTAAPAKTAVEFGQSVQVHELTGVKEGAEDADGGLFEAVLSETDGEQGVVMGPNRAIVV